MDIKKWECGALEGSEKIFLMNSGLSQAAEPVYHDFAMIVYIAHGEGMHHIDGRDIEISEGDIFIVNPSVVHSFSRSERVQYLEMYYCFLAPEKAESVYSKLQNDFPELRPFFENSAIHYLHIKDSSSKEIRSIFIRMIDEFMTCPPGSKTLISCYLAIMLAKIFRRYLHSMNNPVFNRNQTVDHVIRYINYNLNYGVSLRDIAGAFHLSEEYLCRLFKKHTGTTIKQFIINLRIEKAKDLLRNTDRSVESIAVSLNCNQTYLNRLFKKYTGLTLLAYRKKYHYKT